MKTKLFRKNNQRRTILSRVAHLSCLLLLLTATFCVAAQNGVTVTNLAMDAGTVTFDVSWKKADMLALWSDSVWVFVDYNSNGVMERLPLLPGATLTATSAPGKGKVIKVSGNDRGVWVVGNAKTSGAGSFSATVQLLTETATATGACAYASNYPPVGEYTSVTNISFTGTPPYALVLKQVGGATTHTGASLDGSYLVPAGFTVESFTDKTGAPGTFTCVLPTITAQPASTFTCSGGTVKLSVTASPATAWQWKKNSANVSEGSGGTTSNYITAALTAGATYSVVVANGSCSVTSNDAVVSIKTEGCGVNQPQGSCTFTQPPVVGTFANFRNDYSASTFVTLTDERDNNNYTVVKIGSRWIMAQNLNYQKGLYWQAKPQDPSTGTGQNPALIGHFWCPGSSSSVTCNLYGAMYSWETAMSFDGKGVWTEASGSYCTGAANTDNCKINHGRTSSGSGTGGRGICPPNWHVPTDFEWGVIVDNMESDGGTTHQTVSGAGWFGKNAGTRGKAKCSGTTSDADPVWSSGAGTDNYGFRGLPAGYRGNDGSGFYDRGAYAFFWSSSANSSSAAWHRAFYYTYATVRRYYNNRSDGLSVRCIRD